MTADPAAPASAADRATAAVVLARCDELARHTSRDDGLIERVYLSPEQAAVDAIAAGWMREAGMTTWRDAAGNRCGRLEGATPGLPALLIGSHLDTVPAAGRYDGILGVLGAVAIVDRIRASGRPLPVALEVVAFADEEGTRFGRALLGSRALAGSWDDAWWDLADRDGVALRDAFAAAGLDPARVGDAARRPEELVGYLEAHIEQGPYLEEADRALGVVTSIAAARRLVVRVHGHAGHAGTPFARRRDALAGASEVVLAIERIVRAEGLIATVGQLTVAPGAVNVIAGEVELSVDLRAEHDADRDRVWDLVAAEVDRICTARGLSWDAHDTHRAPAARCDDRLRDAVAHGVRSTGDADPLALFSRAGHDAMAVAEVTPMGMLFVRCAGGVSHHPDEAVTEPDVQAMLDALEAAVVHVLDDRGAR
ncbi:allantoate amidohydrolase [Clavibacter sp. Sh2141]|uniref:allantoate amidohydrolase n=1 Tax=Clavibacter sp. Sh2141 TaxID=3395374 RepID=UPI0039BCA98C